MVHPGQRGQVAVARPGSGRRGCARPGWRSRRRRRRSRRPSRARCRVEPDRGVPVPGDARAARPRVGDPAPSQRREQVDERPRAGAREHARRPGRTPGRIAEPEVVRRAPAAEGEPVVRGALPVDDQVPGSVKVSPRGPGRSRAQTSARQRLGGDHQRVDRHDVARGPGSVGRPRLGGPDHAPAPARCRGRSPTRPRRERAAPASARRCGRPALDGARPARGPAGPGGSRAQCGVYVPPSTPAAPHGSRDAVGVQQVRLVAPAAVRGDLGARPARAGPAVRASATVPPVAKSQSMPLGRGDAADLVDGVAHGPRASRAPRRGRAGGPARRPDTGNSAEHQPPLRPHAPNPATSRSTTQRRAATGRPRAGSTPSTGRCSPAPTIADVAVGVAVERRAGGGHVGVRSARRWSHHSETGGRHGVTGAPTPR